MPFYQHYLAKPWEFHYKILIEKTSATKKSSLLPNLDSSCTNISNRKQRFQFLLKRLHYVPILYFYSPSLTWRDVQYISVLAATPGSLGANDWVTNGAGKRVSHHFGFGMMDAGMMVDLATNWTNIPEQHVCEVDSLKRNL